MNDRLQELNIPSLLYRCKRDDKLSVFKVIKGIGDIPIDNFFQISESTTRGHILDIFKPRCQKSICQSSFLV